MRNMLFPTEYTGVAKELLSGLPSIRLIGNTITEVVNHKGLQEYSEELVSVNTKIGLLKIEGHHLHIQEITPEGLRVEGRVKKIAYG